jgi:hypothetical protein
MGATRLLGFYKSIVKLVYTWGCLNGDRTEQLEESGESKDTCNTPCYEETNPYLKIANQILRQESLVLKSNFKLKFGYEGIK